MSSTDANCIYNKSHVVNIFEKNRRLEERELNIAIHEINDRDILQIKVKDNGDFTFNYSEDIDLGDFEIMRNNQNLDINFAEFKTDLIEMLQQIQKKEMFLKIECNDDKCTMVFFGKSKIKFITFLTIDLKQTNQKEIFLEMNNNLKQLKDVNDRLQWQLANTKQCLTDKDLQIQKIFTSKKSMQTQFINNLKQIEVSFNEHYAQVEQQLSSKLHVLNNRLTHLMQKIKMVKSDNVLKSNSSERLLRSMESLRLETIENATLINQLKTENSCLQAAKSNMEKKLNELQIKFDEIGQVNHELHGKNEELTKDLEKITVILAQKKERSNELALDLVQANQMLVKFNNHYDMKAKQIDELNNAIAAKDQYIQDQRIRANDLLREFEEYKKEFNSEANIRLKHDLTLANSKIAELEATVRKANKLNGLLSQKVSGQMGLHTG